MRIEFGSNLCLNRKKFKKCVENFSNDWMILIFDQFDHRHSPAEHFDCILLENEATKLKLYTEFRVCI